MQMKLKNRDWSPGLIIIGFLIILCSIPGPFTLMTVFIILFAFHSILLGILKKCHKNVLALSMGVSLLICTLIWTLTENTQITGYPNIFYIITALLFISEGILGFLGLIPEWFYRRNL